MSDFIKNLEKDFGVGRIAKRLNDLQPKVIEAVRETALQGKITLTITYKNTGASTISVGAKVSSVIPERTIAPVEMFVDETNKLHDENPEQMQFGDNVQEIKPKKQVNAI